MNRKTALRIYIAGPYSAKDVKEVEANVKRAIEAGILLLLKGHYPYIPHLTHYVDLISKENGGPLQWKDYIRWDLKWLELCDAILYLGPSRGADIELEQARKKDMMVFRDVGGVPSVKEIASALPRVKASRKTIRGLLASE